MTPTVPELLMGNFICLMEPPPPESTGEFLQGRIAVTGMIAMLCAQEAKDYGLVDEVVSSRKDVPNFAEASKNKND